MDSVIAFCPIDKITIQLHSEMLDDVGEFTKFILWAIGEGYNVFEIDEVIEIGKHLIEEEIQYLNKIGFIKQEEKYVISNQGLDYLNLIQVLEEFNESNITAYINYVTGKIEKNDITIYEETTIDKNIIKNKNSSNNCIKMIPRIAKHFLFKKNFANSIKFILENYSKLLDKLNDMQKEKLYTQIKLHKNNTQLYMPYYLSEIPRLDIDYEKDMDSDIPIILKRFINNITFTIKDMQLEKYRNSLDTLLKLFQLDKNLLSEKAIKLIKIYENEKIINSKKLQVCIDNYTGDIILNQIVDNNFFTKNIINLKKKESIFNTDDVKNLFNIQDINLMLIEKNRNTKIVSQVIPFSFFSIMKETK